MSKRSEIRERRRRKKQRQQLTLGLIVIGIVLIIIAIILVPYLRPLGEIIIPELVARPMAEGTAMGDPNAPVVMEEYSDYQCSHCRRFSEQTEPILVEQYVETGKLYIVYKNFALYPSSIPIVEASLCAAEHGRFWEYHDILFANQSSDPNNYSDRRLEAYAEAVGLELEPFNNCTRERRYKDEVQQTRLEGESLEITGTPTFLINGKVIEGAQPLEVFQQEIEAALAGR